MEALLIIFAILLFIVVIAIAFGLKGTKAKRRGDRGEAKVADMLLDLQAKYGGYVINNVILPIGKTSSQIDHIYFSKRGIFVVETKNYSGRIYGKDNSEYWTQTLIGRHRVVKNKLYNPIMQNARHIQAVKRLIGNRDDVFSLVIFAKGNISYIESENVYSVNSGRNYILKFPELLTDDKIQELYRKILAFKEDGLISEEEHIKNVKSNH